MWPSLSLSYPSLLLLWQLLLLLLLWWWWLLLPLLPLLMWWWGWMRRKKRGWGAHRGCRCPCHCPTCHCRGCGHRHHAHCVVGGWWWWWWWWWWWSLPLLPLLPCCCSGGGGWSSVGAILCLFRVTWPDPSESDIYCSILGIPIWPICSTVKHIQLAHVYRFKSHPAYFFWAGMQYNYQNKIFQKSIISILVW